MSLRPGEIFAGYRILRPLGAGGMGAVYLAQHPRLPRRDALKILDPALGADPEFRARFEREADLAARLEHPNVVAVYDRGAEGAALWIAMRYVDGVDAAELVRRGPGALPPARAVRIVAAAARGLDAAHRLRLLHRDVKPANIMVSADDDGGDVVRLTDFGIARPLGAATSLTVTGSVLATFAYAAPELLDGGPVDHRADVYSLGCTLYEMLTGAPPFGRRPPAAAMAAHLFEQPPRVSTAAPVPTAMDAVIARALAKRADERFADCGELAEAATRALAGDGASVIPGAVTPGQGGAGSSGAGSPDVPGSGPGSGGERGQAGAAPPGERGSGPARWVAVAAAVVAVIAVLAGTLVVLGRSDVTGTAAPAPNSSAPAPTSRTTTAVPTSAVSAAWGPAAYIAEAFPGLVPADPEGAGYLGMRCALNDDRGAWLHCPADDDGFSVNIRCDPARRPVTYPADTLGRAEIREERWSRPSGTGTVRYATDDTAGYGLLDIAFDDPDRSFCTVGASGGSGGQDVFERWWAGAPL